MTTIELKSDLYRLIEKTNNARILKEAKKLLVNFTNEQKKVKAEVYYRAGKAISKQQLYKDLLEAEAEIKNGKFTTIEDFEKEVAEWD
jgi:hypothetical protein